MNDKHPTDPRETKRPKYVYPLARKGEIVDDFHGTPVRDPYRWLEDPNSAETNAWVDAQNELTRDFLDEVPARASIHRRMTQLWDYPKYAAPDRKGDRYFFYKNDGLQNQAVLYRQDALDGEATILLDPNRLSENGTAAITSQSFSKDGRKFAYGLSRSGSDQQEIFIRDVESGLDHDDVLRYCRFASIAWKHDGSGFFYNRNPEPGSVLEADLYKHSKLYWHNLGTPQSEDKLIYERPDAPELSFPPIITDDGRYIVLDVWHAAVSKNRLYYREVEDEGDFIRLIDEPDASYKFVGNDGNTFYVQTDLDAPNGRIVAIDLSHAGRESWQTLVPEGTDPIASVGLINDQFIVVTMHTAYHQIKRYDLDGSLLGEIELPTLGSVVSVNGRRGDSELFINFESYIFSSTPFRYDFETDQMDPLRESSIDFDPLSYETKQVFYQSKDGTQVSMFLTHKKALALHGDNPTLLYGYGGFNISLTPTFAVSTLHWLELGGVYAVANLRGGNEYGEAWHEDGMLANKQNVFDDFISAAQWLIDNGYTNSRRLGIMGRSNGGLLVSACVLQRPELFGAVICGVPVTDMLRYHKFTAGRYWTAEYGNAEEPDHFPFMIAYSPLHNIRSNVTHPPTLITTADTDDRVVPLHAKKFAAALQAADSGANPLLIRIETQAGHGLGKPTKKVIDEHSDVYAFLWATLVAEER
jgi:prolyl oligopeptidase